MLLLNDYENDSETINGEIALKKVGIYPIFSNGNLQAEPTVLEFGVLKTKTIHGKSIWPIWSIFDMLGNQTNNTSLWKGEPKIRALDLLSFEYPDPRWRKKATRFSPENSNFTLFNFNYGHEINNYSFGK